MSARNWLMAAPAPRAPPAPLEPFAPVPRQTSPSSANAESAVADLSPCPSLILARRWLAAADLQAQLGERQLAIAACGEAVRLAPAYPETWLALARACEDGGDAAAGAVAYARAQSAAMPDDTIHEPTRGQWALLRRVHQRMARYRLARGDAEGALRCLRAALAAARNGQEVNSLLLEIRLAPGRRRPTRATAEAHLALLDALGDDRSLMPHPPAVEGPADAPAMLPRGMVLGGTWVPLRR